MALLSTEYIPVKPLIAIIGEEASKQALTAYLKHQFVPQLNVISCLDASEFASCLAPRTAYGMDETTPQGQTHQRTGILRADWLEKHQSRRPAVALVLVPRHQATGDPSSWASLAASLDTLRTVAKSAKIRVVVAVIQPSGDTSLLPDDRTAMLARHSGAERNCVVLYEGLGGGGSSSSSSSGKSNEAAMRSLAVLLQAQAAIFYSINAQCRLNSYSQTGLASVDANLRAAFKLGALAEMRGDWPGAVQLYKEAYGYVGQVQMAGGAPLQRFLEVRTVAELVHHRLLALLLGALRDPQAASTQLSTHLDMLRTVPLQSSTVPASLLANHYGWLSQQYTTAAELVISSGLSPSSFSPSMRPAQLFIEAYHAAAIRRRIVQDLRNTRGGSFVALSNKEESVSSGRYLGQIEIPRGFSNPSDEQVETWLEMEEIESMQENISGSSDSNGKYSCLYLLKAAEDAATMATTTSVSLSKTSSKRLLASIDTLLGEELLYFSQDITAAKTALSAAAEQYRKDRWYGPLYRVLMALRECAWKEGSTAEHVTLVLEASTIASAVSSLDKSNHIDTDSDTAKVAEVVAMAQTAIEELNKNFKDGHLDYVVESDTAPWGTILQLTSAQWSSCISSRTSTSVKDSLAPPSLEEKSNGGGDSGGDGSSVSNDKTPFQFVVKLVNTTPVDIPLLSASMVFEDIHGAFEVASLKSETTIIASAVSGKQTNRGSTTNLELVFSIPSSRKPSAWIEASKLIVNVNTNVSITYMLPGALQKTAAAAAAATLLQTPLLGKVEPDGRKEGLRIELPPKNRHKAPEISLLVPEKAYIGEFLPAKVKIMATHRSGQKIKKGRVVVSAAISGKAAAILFKTTNNRHGNPHGDQLEQQLEFDIEDLNKNIGNDNLVEIVFGFAVQAPVEETLLFSARLYYNILEDLEEEEIGKKSSVEVLAAVPVLLPFECDVDIVQMAIPTHSSHNGTSGISTHNTTNASTILAGPVFILDSSSSSSPSIGNLTTASSTPTIVEIENALAASLQSLSIQDAQVRRSVLPRLPSHFTLPFSTYTKNTFENGKKDRCCAVVSLRKVKPTGREWSNDSTVENLSITGLSICEKIEKEGASKNNVSVLHIAPLTENESVKSSSTNSNSTIVLAETSTAGDTCCTAFQLTVDKKEEEEEEEDNANNATSVVPSLGNLIINWRRRSPVPLLSHSNSSAIPRDSPSSPHKMNDFSPLFAGTGTLEEGNAVDYGDINGFQDSKLFIPLPPVLLTSSLLGVQPFYPPHATAGEPITLEIEIGFPGDREILQRSVYQEVEVVVGEPNGFLIAGPRATTVPFPKQSGSGSGSGGGLKSKSSSRVSFILVPYHVGYLNLPEIKVFVNGERELQATQGCIVYVKPAAVNGGAAVASE